MNFGETRQTMLFSYSKPWTQMPNRGNRYLTAGHYLILLVVMTALVAAACSNGGATPVPSTNGSSNTEATSGDTDSSNSTTDEPQATAAPESTTTTATTTTTTTTATTSGDRTELDALLRTAQDALGVTAPGWDEPHGAAYSLFSYAQTDDIYMLVATFAADDDLGRALAFGEEVEPDQPPERIEANNQTIVVYSADSEDGRIHAAVLDNLCGRYDLWAVAIVDDPSLLVGDLITVAAAVDCP